MSGSLISPVATRAYCGSFVALRRLSQRADPSLSPPLGAATVDGSARVPSTDAGTRGERGGETCGVRGEWIARVSGEGGNQGLVQRLLNTVVA